MIGARKLVNGLAKHTTFLRAWMGVMVVLMLTMRAVCVGTS